MVVRKRGRYGGSKLLNIKEKKGWEVDKFCYGGDWICDNGVPTS